MITLLRIQNVALIEEVEVAFEAGLNVLTGETGAGKSIVVDSINFMLGERPARDFIRRGAESASVEALLDVRDKNCLKALAEMDASPEDGGQVTLRRTLNTQGKSVCRINNRVVTVGMLKEISALLVDVHGQHEHQSLLDTNKQLRLLDLFCGEALEAPKRVLDEHLRRYRENGRRIKALSGYGAGRETQLEIWRYQTDEIEKAKLTPGEEEALLAKRTRLNGLEKLSRYTAEALALLCGGEGNDNAAAEWVGRAASLLAEIGRLDPSRAALADSLSEAAVIIADTAAELRRFAQELEDDPQALERTEARLDLIYRLKKKYGPSLADVLAHYEKIKADREALLNSGEELRRLEESRKNLAREIAGICGQMTEARRAQGLAIQTRIMEVLRDLGMRHALFEIAFEKKAAFGPEGNDAVNFLITPNPGEPLKPLNRIASGGEMSRVMLAVKTVLADADGVETLIFDEIDAGVSGRTAQQVAEKLSRVGRGRQILCITHLPQIAAMADAHFLIEKKTDGERTVTSVQAQDTPRIIQELARLIGGAQITGATHEAAGEMKRQADALKKTTGP